MKLTLFSSGEWGGQPHFECDICAVTSFNRGFMVDHVANSHKDKLEYMNALGDASDIIARGEYPAFNGRVMLSAIFWQNDETVDDTINALWLEAIKLKSIGITPIIGLASGGTTDKFRYLLPRIRVACNDRDIDLRYTVDIANIGSSRLRNHLIDMSDDCDYIMFTDGDIEVVPYSSMAMVNLLNFNKSLSCVGAYAQSCSKDRQDCTPEYPCIQYMLIRNDPFIAWTQYGMFRRDIFKTCRFEVGGPFTGAGWGFEDDDMAMQIRQAGGEIVNFRGMCYLHRNMRSSIKSLREIGVDPKAMFETRKNYFIAKWKGFHHNVSGMQFPQGH